MPRRTTRDTRPELSAEQKVEADRILATILEAAECDLRELAELLVSQSDASMFGAIEFTVRDIVLRVGAKAVATALEERKKGVRRVQPSLSRLPRAGQVPALADQRGCVRMALSGFGSDVVVVR